MTSTVHRNTFERVDPRGRAAFTLIELLAVITIVAVLIGVSVLVAGGLRKKAERAACSKNLTTLYVALESYLQEHNRWPQIPDQDEEEKYWESWQKVLARYDVPDKAWMCPTYKRATKEEFLRLSSYAPTPFDGTSAMTPYKWNQPWLIEIGDNHGKGPLAIFSDGSVDVTIGPESPKTSLKKR